MKLKIDGSLEQQTLKEYNNGNDDDLVNELLHFHQLHHRFQKLKHQLHNPADTPIIPVEPNLTESNPNQNVT